MVAVGYPFGLDQTVTSGIVSGLSRTGIGTQLEDFIQTDASINSGNSGGPLLDSRGRLVGINTAIYSRGGGNVGIGFAVPSRIVSTIIEQLKAKGKVVRGAIGIQIQAPTPGVLGAIVARIEPGSPAFQSGLREDDLIVAAAGETIRLPADLRRVVALNAPGNVIALDVVRKSQRTTIAVRVMEIPPKTVAIAADGGIVAFGARFAEIGPEHPLSGLVFGVSVIAVDPAGTFGQRKIQVGDVITQVNQIKVTSLVTFQDAVNRSPSRKTLVIARRNALAPFTID